MNDTSETVEIRCPIGPKRLFMVLRLLEERPTVNARNLWEVSCRDCRAVVEKQRGNKPKYVLHKYNVVGELVESEIVWP